MSSDRFDAKAVRDVNSHLNRIAAASEKLVDQIAGIAAEVARIGDALAVANQREADLRGLMDAVMLAKVEAEPKPVTSETPLEDARAADRHVAPPDWARG